MLTPAERSLRLISEAEWQSTVTGLATRFGWKWYHPPRAGVRAKGSVRSTVPGFPDLTLVRGDRLIFAELKKELGKVKDEQREWLAALCGPAWCEVYVWKPSDLPEVGVVLAPEWVAA